MMNRIFGALPGGFRVSGAAFWPILAAAALLAGCSSESRLKRLNEQAQAAFEAEKLEEARIFYLKVLRTDFENVPAYERVGTIWMMQGAPLRAIPYLAKTVELEPDNLEARTELADAFLSLRQVADARREALAVLERAPAHERAILILANASLREEELAEAVARLGAFDPETSVAFHLVTSFSQAKKGQIEAALVSAEKARTIDPNSVAAHLALASLHEVQGQSELAGEALRQAAEFSETRSSVKLTYAQYLAKNGKAQEAKALIEAQLAEAKDYIPGWVLLAELTAVEEHYKNALMLLEKVFGRDPANPRALGMKARILTAMGKTAEATQIYEQLDRTYKDSPLFKYSLAQAHLREGAEIKARAALEQTLALYPDHPDASLQLAQLQMRAGDVTEAVLGLEALIEQRPTLLQAQLMLAEIYESQGRLADAAAIFQRQIASAPQNAGSHLMLGKLLRRQGDLPAARQCLETAQSQAPENLAIVSELVDLDLAEGNFAAAEARIPDFPGKEAQAGELVLRGKIFAAQEKWDEAEETLQKALETQPDLSIARDLLLSVYVRAKKTPQAIEKLKTLLQERPESVQHRILLASLHSESGDDANAAAQYEAGLKAAPNSVAMLNNLAYLYSQQEGRLDDAENLARKARGLLPANPGIADTLGWILYRQGNYQDALRLLEESAAQAKNHPEIQYHLGMARIMMGRHDDARVPLEAAVGSKLEFAGKEEAKRQLALLEDRGSALEQMTPAQLEAHLGQQPNDLRARIRLAQLYGENGATDEAAANFEAALQVDPGSAGALKGLARLNLGPLQDSGKAMDFARKARNAAPSDSEALSLLGRAALLEGKASWAHGLMESAVRSSGQKDALLLHSLAWSAYHLGRVDDARGWMQQVLKNGPKAEQATDAADFLTLTDETSANSAAKAGEKLNQDAGYVPALMAQARHLAGQQAYGDAMAVYERILIRWPDFPMAQRDLAAIYAQSSHRLDEARNLALQARKIMPGDAELARILGCIGFKRGDQAYAIRMLEESAKTLPLDGEGLVYLGISYLKTGQNDKGAAALRAAIDAGLDENLTEQAKTALEGKGT